jgi:hypothetical protein
VRMGETKLNGIEGVAILWAMTLGL